ncbi:MAG TPA: DUF4034 domain-containing protein [Rhodanobacter sp.]|nr:DUF4034 domain-containing protein [Rhodanobacter sp.]
MGSGPRWLLLTAIIVLGLGEFGWGLHLGMVGFKADLHAAALQHPAARPPQRANARPLPATKPHLFTRDEANAFLDKARKAEAIADPLQRCLAYPDPPGSHWSADAVRAYCHYRFQHVITFGEVQKLIQDGRAAEVDRRFAQMLQAQLTEPDARGRLDRAFYQDFNNGSFDIRPTLDAWTRDAPNSAFAWAASGYAYVQMAAKARGAEYMADTPQSSVDAMDKLLVLADSDLRHALALEPRLTPAYSAMINAGTLGLGHRYVADAARRGLAIAPDNLDIYDMLIWSYQPKWGGSLGKMSALAEQAQRQADKNPLLRMLQSARPYYEVDNCGCATALELAAYPAALDQLISSGNLLMAGNAARGNNHAVSLIYLSEALRFNPALDYARMNRVYDLVDFDEAAWGVAEASHAIKALPRDGEPLKARAYAYMMQGDYSRAEQDYRAAFTLVPTDLESLARLGDLYVNQTHDWDKGWAVADQLIKARPDYPYGWMLRADIQQHQPRPGMQDTVEYFEQHFAGKNAQLHKIAVEMRSAMVLQNHSGAKVLAAKPAHVTAAR